MENKIEIHSEMTELKITIYIYRKYIYIYFLIFPANPYLCTKQKISKAVSHLAKILF